MTLAVLCAVVVLNATLLVLNVRLCHRLTGKWWPW